MDDEGLVVITQPAHAWISGQLAAQWGNEAIELTVPDREVRLAAEQHDLAWLDWETRPSLSPGTGLPYAFNQLPTLEHLDIWSGATARALVFGIYPALLISMHGTYLYERFHDFEADSNDEARAAREFVDREQVFQEQAIAELARARGIARATIERDRRLVSLWDAMSLSICMGNTDTRTFPDVPGDRAEFNLALTRTEGDVDAIECNPWPFTAGEFTVGCEARRLDGRFGDVGGLRSALEDAPRIQFEARLVPA
jgi:hypothetical protein